MKVTAATAQGSSGSWVRSVEEPGRRFVSTVAHILYDRNGRLRDEVSIGGRPARVHAIIELPRVRRTPADAALVEPDPDWADAHFEPGVGHLNEFVPDLPVTCRLRDGRTLQGRLAREAWSGRMAYNFGTRWVTDQWIINIDRRMQTGGGRPICRGDSGLVWTTADGVAVGIQAGVLSARPFEAIVTPFETCCRLFNVRVAAP